MWRRYGLPLRPTTRAERVVERPAPVRERRTIEEISKQLYGAAKERWLEKWIKWIDKLFHDYDIKEDPEALLGIRDIHDPAQIESFLLEHYRDLTEDEALTKIREMLRERGYKENVTDEMLDSMLDYWESVKYRPEITYALPYNVRSEVEELREHPELDSNRAYKLVYDFLTSEGVEHKEADRIAKEIAASIPKMKPEDRKVLYSQLVHVAKLAKQTSLTQFLNLDRKAEETAKQAREDLRKTAWLIEWQDRVFTEAAKLFVKTMGRGLRDEERRKLREIIGNYAASIDKAGFTRDEAFRMIDKYAKESFELLLKEITPYEKVVEALKVAPPAIAPPTRIPTIPTFKPIPSGPAVISIDDLVKRGAKLIEAKHTKTIDETLKVLEEWAKKNKLKMTVKDRLTVRRTEFSRLNIIYYPNQKPERVYIDCLNNECIIERIDKPTVAYVSRVGEVEIATYR